MMAYIPQRHKTDCGVAAIAMLCNVSYVEADRVIPWRKHGCLYGTDTKMLRTAAERLGYEGRGTPKHHLKRLPRGAEFTTIPDNSLVKVPCPPGDTGWHWVAWINGRIYDPVRGVFNPNALKLIPSAYMQFTKETDDV